MKRKTFINPVFDENFPDPGILRTPEGYHAFGTQSRVMGKFQNIQHLFSKDLIHWERRPDALPVKAIWGTQQDYWAPDPVSLDSQNFRMFFNAVVNGSGHGLGVAVSSSLDDPFVVAGGPLIHDRDYINIDAKAFQNSDDGKWYLVWGSCFEPIKIQELRDDLLGFKNPDDKPIHLLTPDPNDRDTKLYEAPWIMERVSKTGKKYWYLFTSGSDAFGDDSYTVQVARSSEGPTSGFKTRKQVTGSADSVILRGNKKFLNPGASSFTIDDLQQTFMLSHAMLRPSRANYIALKKAGRLCEENSVRPRALVIDQLHFGDDDWPYIKDNSPAIKRQPAPVLFKC